MVDSPVIEIKDLNFSYDGAPVLESVNLLVEPLDFACIVGPNGGGKTTLLKLILGLEKPKSGTVRIFGEPPERTRSSIGYMPQFAHMDRMFPITVMDVVLTGRLGRKKLIGRYSKTDKEMALKALSEVGMEGMSKRSFGVLSGGQRQRLLISRALVSEPELLLLDEPTANLDPQAEQDFYSLLHDLNHRLTIVLVSHDLAFVSSSVKTVICVNRKVAVHPTKDIPSDVAGDILAGDFRMILHDQECRVGENK